MYFVNRLLSALLLLTLLFGCSSSSDSTNSTPKHHLLIQQKYAAIQAASAHRSKTQGIAFDKHHADGLLTAKSLGVSTSTVNNGRVISANSVWLDNGSSVDYVAFSFMSDELLKTGSLPDNKPTATTQVWRHYNNKWCPVLAFQEDNSAPLLGFSVASSAPWIEQANNQVTYRLFVGTAEGKVGKVSFLDTDPISDSCHQSIGFADGETTHAVFYNVGIETGTPINGMKLADFQEEFSGVQPSSLQMTSKRVLYWWGNTSNCTDDKCANWQAERAKAMLLVNGTLSPSYNTEFYERILTTPWYFYLDQAASYTTFGQLGNRVNNTKIGDVDLRLKYNNNLQKVSMDWAIVYQTLPTDQQGQTFSQVPNITTRSYEFQLNGSEDYDSTAWGISGLNNSGNYSYHAGPKGGGGSYSPSAQVKIFDLQTKSYVAVYNQGDLNASGICPLIGTSDQCTDMGWQTVNNAHENAGISNVVTTRLEVASVYKGFGFETIGLTASNINQPRPDPSNPINPFPFNSATSGIAIMGLGKINDLSDKLYLQGYNADQFVTNIPYQNGLKDALTGKLNLAQMRAFMVPEAGVDPMKSARLFLIFSIADNILYNPIVNASGKTNVNGGLMMCTGNVDIDFFIRSRQNIPDFVMSSGELLASLNCDPEWGAGLTTGHKFASAQDIVLNGTYKTSVDGMSLSISADNKIILSYVSSAGALLNLDITDGNTAWTGQTSWTMISEGRAAECHNVMDKPAPPPPSPPPSQPWWKRALTKVIPLTGPILTGESWKAAIESTLVDYAEIGSDLACEDLGPVAAVCGNVAGKGADLLIDAVDSKARTEASSSGDSSYKNVYDKTVELTKCTGG